MSTDKNPEVSEQEELREQIERTRGELGDTVQALSDKTDVKARLHDRVEDTKQQVHDKVRTGGARAGSEPGRRIAAGVVLAIAVLLIIRKGRS